MKLVRVALATAIALGLPAAAMADVGTTQFVSNPVVQTLPPADTPPPNGMVPICKPGQQTTCVNRYQATGKGTRPLHYWPGHPASSEPGNADH